MAAPLASAPPSQAPSASSTTTTVDNWLTEDKAAYNKFMYRLNRMGSEAKEVWKGLRGNGGADQQQSFFQEIMTFNPKKNSESVLNKYRSISNISERGETGGSGKQ